MDFSTILREAHAKATKTKGTFSLAISNGEEATAEGWLVGSFGLAKDTSGERWIITHLNSGMSLGPALARLQAAVIFATALDVQWEGWSKVSNMRDVPQDVISFYNRLYKSTHTSGPDSVAFMGN